MTEKEHTALLDCGLFQGIQDIPSLLKCLRGERAAYEKNEIIWHIGDEITACAVILSGAVRAESVNAAGEHSLMAVHRSGGLVGDVLMATPGGKSPVYVIASEPTEVLFLPYHRIMGGCAKCCPAHVQLRENLIAQIAQKFWAQRRRSHYLAQTSLRRRISMYLLDKSTDCGPTFSLGGTREDLADFLCVNRSALSRELGRMKRDGLIDFYKDTFRILDRGKMQLED